MKKETFVLAEFDNNDCTIYGKYRIDNLGRKIKIITSILPTKIDVGYNLIIESVELKILDEYENILVEFSDVYYDCKTKKYYLYSDKEYSAACTKNQIEYFIKKFVESNGLELTKYITPFLAKVDLDYAEKHTPEKLSEKAKATIKKARELGYKSLGDLDKNGSDAHKKIAIDCLK